MNISHATSTPLKWRELKKHLVFTSRSHSTPQQCIFHTTWNHFFKY